MTTVDFLPEGCIANVVSLTSPRDACRLSLVASTIKSAADSDAVWERFLPFDYKDIITGAVDPPPFTSLMPSISKKELYLWLSDHPLLIDHGNKSFSLEKSSGRRCYMLAARDLTIVWGDTPRYWKWVSIPESRFPEVAELVNVCWLEIRGKIKTSMLSPDTTYAAFLVFKPTAGVYGFVYQPAEVGVGISGGESEFQTVYLDPEGGQTQRYPSLPRRSGLFNRGFRLPSTLRRPHVSSPLNRESNRKCPKVRGDAWMEIELGEYFNNRGGGEDRELEMSLMEVAGGNWKSGLIVQGIEIRPKVVEE